MQPQQQTAGAGQAPRNQSRVQYLGNVRKFGNSRLGLLEWSSDDHIRLFMIDAATNQSKGIAFDCPLSQIRRAKANGTMLALKLDSQNHLLSFSNYFGSGLLRAGGVGGMTAAQSQQERSGIQWWVDALNQRGVSCKQTDAFPKWLRVTIVVMLGILALQLIFVLAPRLF